MEHKIIHFDSIDGVQQYDTTFNLYHCYKTNIALTSAVKKIKSIELLSVELPLQFFNIRNSNLSDTLKFKFSYSTYTNISISCVIKNQSYTAIATLLSTINTAVATLISSYGLTFTLSLSSNSIILTTNATSLTFTSGILVNNILGLSSTDVLSSNQISFSNNYNLNPDNFISLYISNLPISSNHASGRNNTFKIPLNATSGQIVFFHSFSGFIQPRTINDDNFVLEKLNIIMYDRFGYPINGGGGDFSFTLKILHDI